MEETKKHENTALSGIKAIQTFCGSIGLKSSLVSVMDMIKYEGLPAKKLGGIWESDEELIIKWRKDRINGTATTKPETPTGEKKADKNRAKQQNIKK